MMDLFKMVDTNGDGQIDKNEFTNLIQQALEKTGENVSDSKIKEFVDFAFEKDDKDGNGTISFQEFCGQ